MNHTLKEKKKDEFHAYWQCPNCEKVNMNIATDDCLEMKNFSCQHCKHRVTLIKAVTQVLCSPLTFVQNRI